MNSGKGKFGASGESFPSSNERCTRNQSKELEISIKKEFSATETRTSSSLNSRSERDSSKHLRSASKNIKKEVRIMNLRSQSQEVGIRRDHPLKSSLEDDFIFGWRGTSLNQNKLNREQSSHKDFSKPNKKDQKMTLVKANSSQVQKTNTKPDQVLDKSTLLSSFIKFRKKSAGRAFFHGQNMFKRNEPEEIFRDGEDSVENFGEEDDYDVIFNTEAKMLDEYADIAPKDKEFFKIWNHFVKTDTFETQKNFKEAGRVPKFVEIHEKFVKIHKSRLVSELRLNFLSHLVNLLDLNQLTREEINYLIQLLNQK